MPEPVAVAVLLATAAVLAGLVPFAAHRAHLLALARRRGRPGWRYGSDGGRGKAGPWETAGGARGRAAPGDGATGGLPGSPPVVTVQLPVYNEAPVVERLIDAACSLDHPRHLLEVQVLDDSNDETTLLAAERVAEWRRRGVDVRHVRRGDRTGFKAGALAEGVARARGSMFLVLDADFVPEPDLIRRLLPPFRDPRVGMVQARWDHLNERENALTRAQALLLDGHFFFEHGGRYAADRFFNFNGTAGMWRRACLEEAGGWQADTLTEDLDLSYRAQMAGWRFVFLEETGVPAELPAAAGALKVQQRRWAQGGVQTARKILPALLRGPYRADQKSEAVFHLCGHLAHPLTLLLGVLLFPSAVARRTLGLDHLLGLDVVLFVCAAAPFFAFYAAAGRRRGRPWRWVAGSVVRALAVGIGLSASVSRAVLRGLGGGQDPFVRTPKRGGARRSRYAGGVRPSDAALELGMGALTLAYLTVAVAGGYWAQIPFVLLFASGYLVLGLSSASEWLVASRATPPRAEALHGQEEDHGSPEEDAGPRRLGPDPGVLIGA